MTSNPEPSTSSTPRRSTSTEGGAPSTRRRAPSARVVLAAVVVLILLYGLTATIFFGVILRLLDQQSTTDDLAACRSAYSVELVSGPTARALKALGEHGADSPEFRAASDDADPDRLEELVRQSRTDPDAFLRECRAERP